MAVVGCVDGAVLTVLPVPVLDRDDVPYEVTLRLLRDGEEFGEVGERCGFFLAATASRLRAARAAGLVFPASSVESGIRAWAGDRPELTGATWRDVERYLPRDRELFCFRARDPDDLSTVGELRVTLQVERTWDTSRWISTPHAVLEAWGGSGQGLRAVLTSDQLLGLLEQLVRDFADVGATYALDDDLDGIRRPVG